MGTMRSRVWRASSGRGRTSLDSMTYSSESSPTARRSRAGEGISRKVPCSMLAWLNDESEGSSGEAPEEGTSRHNQTNSAQCAARTATGDAGTRQEHVLEVETAAPVSTKVTPGRYDKEATAVNGREYEQSSAVELRRVCSRGCSAPEVEFQTHEEGRRQQRGNAQKAVNPLAQGRGLDNVAMPSSGSEGNKAGTSGSGDCPGASSTFEGSITNPASLSQRFTAPATPLNKRATVTPGRGIGPEGEAEVGRQDNGSIKEPRNRTEAEMQLWLSQDSEEEGSVDDEKEQGGMQLGRDELGIGTTLLSEERTRKRSTLSEEVHPATRMGRRSAAVIARSSLPTLSSVSPTDRRVQGGSRASPRSTPLSSAGSDDDDVISGGEKREGMGDTDARCTPPTEKNRTSSSKTYRRNFTQRRNSVAAAEGGARPSENLDDVADPPGSVGFLTVAGGGTVSPSALSPSPRSESTEKQREDFLSRGRREAIQQSVVCSDTRSTTTATRGSTATAWHMGRTVGVAFSEARLSTMAQTRNSRIDSDGRETIVGPDFASSPAARAVEKRGTLVKRVASRERNVSRSRSPARPVMVTEEMEPRSGTGTGAQGGENDDGLADKVVPRILENFQSLVLDNGRELASQPRCLHQDDGDRVRVYNEKAQGRFGSALSNRCSPSRDGSSSGGEGEGISESTSGGSFVSFGSSIGGSEVNDFLLECTEDSDTENAARGDGGGRNGGEGDEAYACSGHEVGNVFSSSSSSSSLLSSSSSSFSSGSSARPVAGGTRGGGNKKSRRHEQRHRHRQRQQQRHQRGSIVSPLVSSPAFRTLSKEDRRFMQENAALWKGLCSVVGLNFAGFPPKRQLEIMKPMETKSYQKGEVIVKVGDDCRRFYVVLGAPRELLDVGEIPAVSRETPSSNSNTTNGCRLLSGQFFGGKGLLRQAECKRTSTMIAVSTVVDVASVDIGDMAMDLWEPFRMFLVLKEVPLLSSLPMPIFDALQQAFQHRNYIDGEYIVRQGEPGDVFYMIAKGTVDVIHAFADPDTGDIREQEVVQMYEGLYFGELALIYGEPRSASVRAKGEVRCVCISKEDFRSCMNEKKFQEVLENVAYQRAAYRERKERQLLEEKEQTATATTTPNRRHRRSLSRSQPNVSPCSSCGALDELGGGDALVFTPPPLASSGSRRLWASPCSGGRKSSSSHSLQRQQQQQRQSFRESSKVVRRKMDNGTTIINKYEIVQEIGRGSYGSVHLCRDGDTGLQYAMKVIGKGKGKRGLRRQSRGQEAQHRLVETLRREVAVMKKLRHPNIVTLWEVIDDPRAQQLYMIQEYIEEGPLLSQGVVVTPLSTEDARRKFVGCVRGLYYLHQHGVVHGDIKPQNILVAADGTVKIADFGAAVVLQHQPARYGEEEGKNTMRNTLTSTPAFTAPELFGDSTTVSPASDVWAMGVTLYQMVHGTLPFWPESGNHAELAVMVKHRELSFPALETGFKSVAGNIGGGGGSCNSRSSSCEEGDGDWREGCTSSATSYLGAHDPMVGYLRNLLQGMLEKNHVDRIGLRDAIKHPWVTLEGSVSPDELEDETHDDSSGCGLEVTDGELLHAWTTFPHQASSPGSCSSPGSRASSMRSMATAFFSQQEHHGNNSSFLRPDRAAAAAVATTNINSNKCATTTATATTGDRSRSSPSSQWTGDGSISPRTSRCVNVAAAGGATGGPFSPLQSPCCPTTQLTPSMVGNLNRFGWRTVTAVATAAGHKQQRHNSETLASEVSGSGGRSGGRGVSGDVCREGPPSQWARSRTASISPAGPKSRRARGLPCHLSIETEQPAAEMVFLSPSTTATPGTSASGTSDAAFFPGTRGSFSPVHLWRWKVDENDVASWAEEASSPTAFFDKRTDASGPRVGISPKHFVQQQRQSLPNKLREDSLRRPLPLGSPVTCCLARDDGIWQRRMARSLSLPQLHGDETGAMDDDQMRGVSFQGLQATAIEEITLQRDVPTPLMASPGGLRRERSSSPVCSSIVGGARTPRARVLSPEGRDRVGAAPGGDDCPGTPPRIPARHDMYGWTTATALGGDGEGLVRGRSTGSLSPPRLGSLPKSPQRLVPSSTSPGKPMSTCLPEASTVGHSTMLSGDDEGEDGRAMTTKDVSADPVEHAEGSLSGQTDGGSCSRSARRKLSVDAAKRMRASFNRQKDFLMISRNLAQDKFGRTNVKARLCIAGTKSSTFSVLRPMPTTSSKRQSRSSSALLQQQQQEHHKHQPHRRAKTSPTPLWSSPDHAKGYDAKGSTKGMSRWRGAWTGASILPRCLSPSEDEKAEDPTSKSGGGGGRVRDKVTSWSSSNVREGFDVVLTLPPPMASLARKDDAEGLKEGDDGEGSKKEDDGEGLKEEEDDGVGSKGGDDGEGSKGGDDGEGSKGDDGEGSKGDDDREGSKGGDDGEGSKGGDDDDGFERKLTSASVRSFLTSSSCSSDSESDDDEKKKESEGRHDIKLLSPSRGRGGFRSVPSANADGDDGEGNAAHPARSSCRASQSVQASTSGQDYDDEVSAAASASDYENDVNEVDRYCPEKRHKKPLERKTGMRRLETATRSTFFTNEDYGGVVGRGTVPSDPEPREMSFEAWEGSSDSSSDLTAEEDEHNGCIDVVQLDPDAIEFALPAGSTLSAPGDVDLREFQPLAVEDLPPYKVQARTWSDQANLSLGLRYGHSAEIGSRRTMEDRTTAIGDMFLPKTPRYIGNRRIGQDVTVTGDDFESVEGSLCPSLLEGMDSRKKEGENRRGDGSSMSPSAAFFAVYDGHDGDAVAEVLHRRFHEVLAKQDCFQDSVPEAIARACYEMDVACLESQHAWLLVQQQQKRRTAGSLSPSGEADNKSGAPHPNASGRRDGRVLPKTSRRGDDARGRLGGVASNRAGGATAVVAVITRVGKEAMIYTGNVGDCRAVLCRGGLAIDLTSDHRFSRTDERKRVKEAGGYISRDRLNGILGVTRAFGDIGFKEYPLHPEAGTRDLWRGQQLTAEPETNVIPVHPEDDFLILACDGVWDLMSSQQTVSYVHRRLLKHRDVQRASRELCKILGKMDGSDNCSCVVVCLNQVSISTPLARRLQQQPTDREHPSTTFSAGSDGLTSPPSLGTAGWLVTGDMAQQL